MEISTAAVTSLQQEAAPALEPEEQAGTQAEAPVETQAEPQPDEAPAFTVFWDQGLHLQALRRSFTLRLAGSAQNESAAFSKSGFETEFGALENGVQWRRVRVFAEGSFARHFSYKLQYDFVQNNPPNLKDMFLGFAAPKLPVKIEVGRFRTPLGLEGHTSCMDLTFMERGLTSTFLPSRNTGVVVYADDSRQAHNLHYSVAAIKPQNDFDFTSTDLLGFSTRFSYAFTPRTDILIHVGGDYMHRPVEETIRFLQRPESNLAPQFVDTGDMLSSSVDTAILELALVRGPWSFQTEGAATWVRRPESDLERLFFWGGYGFVSYMITGEPRPYKKDRGNFGRLRPDNPFFGPGSERGRGALEAAFRISYLDLEDRDIRGGRLFDLTWALNWYATRNARVYTNVVWANPSLSDESVWITQIRLQWAY